jgi:hypothetical protein
MGPPRVSIQMPGQGPEGFNLPFDVLVESCPLTSTDPCWQISPVTPVQG